MIFVIFCFAFQNSQDDNVDAMDIEEEPEAMDVDDEEEEDADVRRSRRSRRQPDRLAGGKRSGRSKYVEDGGVSSNEDNDDDEEEEVAPPAGARRSSRSTKNKGSMKEPTDSVNDLFAGTGTASTIPNRPSKKKAATTKKNKNDDDDDYGADPASPQSPSKMRGRHSRTRRKSRSWP